MDVILKQSPVNMSEETINEIYIKNNNDITKTLMELWEIDDNKPKIPSKTQLKWNEIRETCDAYDFEMTKLLNESKNKNK